MKAEIITKVIAMYTNQNFRDSFKNLKTELDSMLESVDDALFVSLPANGGWCIGEAISHINKTTDLYLGQMEPAFKGDLSALPKGTGPYSLPWTMRMFVKVVSPDFNPKVKTFPVFSPEKKADLDRKALMIHYHHNMDRFLHIVEMAETHSLNLDKIKVRNPVVKFLKMSISACLAIHAAHTKRHLGQIGRLVG